MSFAVIDHRCQYQHLLSCILFENQIKDLVVGILHHFLARSIGVGVRCARKEQAQEIVHLRDRTHCGSWVTRGGLLIDADNR